MTNTYDEYADKAVARYLQGRMDEQAAWVEAVQEMRDKYDVGLLGLPTGKRLRILSGQMAALDALLRRMGVE